MALDFKLTEGALETIMNGGLVTEPLMQVLASKKVSASQIDKEHHRVVLSDGKFTTNIAMLTLQANDENSDALESFSVIRLKRYVANVIKIKDKRDSRILLILDLDVVVRGYIVGHVIGNPVPLSGVNEPDNSQSLNVTALPHHTNTMNKNHINPIASLSPFHNNWVIKARISDKSSIRSWSNARGDGSFFTIDLIDESGVIRCTAFRQLVDKFFDYMEVDKVYYISKCQLKPSNKQFRSTKNEFEMVLTDDSLVEESTSNNNFIPVIKYNFFTIDKIESMEVDNLVDIVAICKHISELETLVSKARNRTFSKRELVLVDQTETAITLTVWESDAELFNDLNNPIVLITNAKIRTFRNSKSLSVSFGTRIKINPNLPEAESLRCWFQTRGNQIEFRNVSDSYRNNIPWMSFKDIQDRNLVGHDKPLFYQTFGTILLVRLDRAVYKACPANDCFKKVTDMENGLYRCEKCNREFSTFKYRLLVSMNISDSSSSHWVTVFSSEAEKILGYTAQEIGEAMDNDQDNVAKIFENAQFKQFVFRCRVTLDNYNDEMKLKTIIVGIHPINYEEYGSYLVEKIDKFRVLVQN